MVSVNRTAVVVRAKQPFLDWLHSADPTSRHLTLPDLNQEASVYLLPDSDSNEKAGRYLRKFCAQIFAHELDGWFRVPSAWPKDLTFQVFTTGWFECSYHSMVLDLGDAPFLGSLGGLRLAQPVVDAAGVPGAAGYWMVAADGGVFTYGAARFFGSAAGAATRPVTGLAPTPAGNGYWLVSVDGGVFSFGGAAFEGSAH